MRGQRLFVRPIDAGDADSVREFLARHHPGAASPSCGLLGKLVGELVAVLSMEVTESAVRLDHLIVAKDLRRKRIGRVMMNELEALAGKLDRTRIEASPSDQTSDQADEFLRRVGFVEEGGRFVRRVG
jgi:GNAT superfamily N-acetyltransferase